MGKNFIKKSVKAMMALIKFVALCVIILLWCVAAVALVALSPIWVTLMFFVKPAKLAKIVNAPIPDTPLEFLSAPVIPTILLFGNIVRWIGTRSWMFAYIRNPFLEQDKKRWLKDYPVKVQISYWNWCSYKESNYEIGLSKEGRLALFEMLVSKIDKAMLKSILNNINEKELFFIDIAELYYKRTDLFRLIKEVFNELMLGYDVKSLKIEKLSNKELDALFELSSQKLKLEILLVRGINLAQLKKMYSSDEGLLLLEAYASKKTISNAALRFLISAAAADGATKCGGRLVDLVCNIIYNQGINQKDYAELKETVSEQNLLNKIDDAVYDYAQKCIVKGSKDASASEEASCQHLARFRKYCEMNEDGLADKPQCEMTFEQYKIYNETGHKLGKFALKHFILNLNDKEFFTLIMKNERKNIPSEMFDFILPCPWKMSVVIDIAYEVRDEKEQSK